MKLKQHKITIVILLLIVSMVLPMGTFNASAETNILQGIEPLTIQENQTIDLLQGVSAISPTGEQLNVTIENISSESDETYQYDGTAFLEAKVKGSPYSVRYKATSATNEESYFSTREITVVPQESSSEDTQVDLSDGTNEKTEEQTADLSDGVNEKPEEIFSDGISKASETGGSGLPIIYENGTHYIEDSEYPNEKITLFCMNNKLHWPHHTNNMGNEKVPNYTEGYLTQEDFSSPEDYAECMRRLSKLLYAGYPYNGERLYKIVENAELHIPTEAEFNEMLIVPPALQKEFPYLGHHAFTYQDWAGQDKEHLKELSDFIGSVSKLYPNGQTENGLTYFDITAMPFYKASLSMLNATDNDNPLTVFAYFYSDSYFVTEEQAYNATQKAVWRLLYSYNIPDNDISNLNDTQLGQILYTYSERGGLLNYEPSLNDIHLSGSLKFRYNPKDGLWHSGVLQVIEPSEYHGIYHLELPRGMTALCDNLSYVYGNEEYELVSDHEPTAEETFGIRAEFIWLKEFKQYSPNPDIEVNGKKFQHMVGAVIRNKKISANVPVGVNKVGALSITKSVIGEENCQEAFEFELRLPYHTSINGLYGDLEFHNGVANFSLKDKETKTATTLPEGAMYEVIEYETKRYQVGMTNNKGEIVKDVTTTVTFTNTKCPDLTLTKIVTGEAGDKTRLFTFAIQLTDKDGNSVNGDYEYKGSVKKGYENEVTMPDNGILTFNNGIAEIALAHGQQITLLNLPPNTNYKVVEKEANQEHYTTTYKGEMEGILTDDYGIEVENNKEFVPDTGVTDINNHSISVGVIIALMTIGSLLFVCLLRWRKGLRK